MILELPTLEDINKFRMMKVIAAPVGLKDVEFDESLREEDYINQGWVVQMVGVAPERMLYFPGNIQVLRKQYGLRHRISTTIHKGMGATLIKTGMEKSGTKHYQK